MGDFVLTRDETLSLVYEKLTNIRNEVDDCDDLAQALREQRRRSLGDTREIGNGRLRARDFATELLGRLKCIEAESLRAMRIIDAHETARMKAEKDPPPANPNEEKP